MFEDLFVAPRKAFARLPGMQLIERPDWVQLVTPGFHDGGLNEVSFSALDARDVGEVIDRTIAHYGQLRLKFRWLVVPGSKPEDLAERLEQRGLRRGWNRAMFRRLTLDDARLSSSAVEEVTPATVDDFTRAMAKGWSAEPGPMLGYNRAAIAEPGQRHRLFLVRRNGEPVAAAGYVALERSAHLMGAVVLPAFRGQGLYRLLVEQRLADAARRGLPLATTHAREETSAPLLERFGFETFRRFCSFSSG
ncbi:MAG TPA: GNAT family N-acetyltransferase [Myxococcaceae bacterium]|nr:GNAT family N-acetyltransferase [Myxococcaceae bacterium]